MLTYLNLELALFDSRPGASHTTRHDRSVRGAPSARLQGPQPHARAALTGNTATAFLRNLRCSAVMSINIWACQTVKNRLNYNTAWLPSATHRPHG